MPRDVADQLMAHARDQLPNEASGLLGGGSRDLVVAAVLILTIMIRPHGLFGRHHIERI